MLLIQKLTGELGLDKNEMLKEMAKQAETESKKSILGRLGTDRVEAKDKAQHETLSTS